MKIALAQMKMDRSAQTNLKTVLEIITQAAQENADLILFPELTLTRFFPQYPGGSRAECAMTLDGPEVAAITACCRENQIYACPNLYLQEDGKNYDCSLLIGPDGKIIGKQTMVHIAEMPQFYEQDYYAPSKEGFQVFDTPLGRIGIVICFDRHYPESIRTEALMGADLILIPTANTKGEPEEMFEWEIRVQAFQNSVNIAMCNRMGREGGMYFDGRSIAVGADGELVLRAGGAGALLLADMNVEKAGEIRRGKPYTSLRRPEMYR